jgi:cytochrome c1
MKRSLCAVVLAAFAAGLSLAACSGGPARPLVVTGGDASDGRTAITHYGCGSCHTIPGVKRASGLVGPPLIHWSRRSYIAGKLANTPDNLESWLRDPQAVWPGNDMPDLHVSAVDARNIAAYLDSIR